MSSGGLGALKECVTIDDARKIIEGIYEQDEEKDARVRTLEETYKKEDPNNVEGYSGLLEVLTSELRDERQAKGLGSGSAKIHN